MNVDPCAGGGKYCVSAVVVVAAPGERNRVRVAAEASAIEVGMRALRRGTRVDCGAGFDLVGYAAPPIVSIAAAT